MITTETPSVTHSTSSGLWRAGGERRESVHLSAETAERRTNALETHQRPVADTDMNHDAKWDQTDDP